MRTLTAGWTPTLLTIRPFLGPGDSDIGTVHDRLGLHLSTAELLFLIDSHHGICYDFFSGSGCRLPIQLKTCDISPSTNFSTPCCHFSTFWTTTFQRALLHIVPNLNSDIVLPCPRDALYFHPCWYSIPNCQRRISWSSDRSVTTYTRSSRTWRVHDGCPWNYSKFQLQ